MLYFLADGIYTSWPLFRKSIHRPLDELELLFTKPQEEIRKDIERWFNVLQSSFLIMKKENRRWEKCEIIHISVTYIVFHNILARLVKMGRVAEENDVEILTELYDEQEQLDGATDMIGDLGNPEYGAIDAFITSLEDQAE